RADGGGGGPPPVLGQTLRGHRAEVLLRGPLSLQVRRRRSALPSRRRQRATLASLCLLCRSCMLQAESEKQRQAWIQAVQASIASAYRESPDTSEERLDRAASPSTSSIDSASEARERGARGDAILQRIQALPGNQQCCDCGQADPRWASINLGVLLCIECSGIHRSARVTLDSWEPELLKVRAGASRANVSRAVGAADPPASPLCPQLMCELGNAVVNRIYECSSQDGGSRKPLPSSSRQEKEAWIRAKYVEKRFLKKACSAHAGQRKPERRRSTKNAGGTAAATAWPRRGAEAAKFRRESLFCPDELDSLFSYFDTGSGPRSLSSDSGLGGSTDGSTDFLLFGSVAEEREVSEGSSGEAELERSLYASDTEEGRDLQPGALLHRASRNQNLAAMAEALAHGADVNSADHADGGKTPLIQAVVGGSLIACEFLLQNAADVNQRDGRGRSPLHHATYLGHTGQVCLFLKRGAAQGDADQDGQDPLSVAVQQANADIVTLCVSVSVGLRLARMNEEMKESEGQAAPCACSPTEQQLRKCFQEFI
ncbi:unnamed protein product, partial [Tetraodon nigroviridis]